MKKYCAIIVVVLVMLLCLTTVSFAIGLPSSQNNKTMPAGSANGENKKWLPPALNKKASEVAAPSMTPGGDFRISPDLQTVDLDVNGDGNVDMADVNAFKGKIGLKAGDEGWNPKLDLNGDGYITVVGDVLMYRGKVTPDPLDVTGDGKVDMQDVNAFKGKIGLKAGDANWDPKLDLNGDGFITVAGDVLMYRGKV